MARTSRYSRLLAATQRERAAWAQLQAKAEAPLDKWARKMRTGEVEPFPPELASKPAGETRLSLFKVTP